jgi:hypothetical protein
MLAGLANVPAAAPAAGSWHAMAGADREIAFISHGWVEACELVQVGEC